MFVKIFLTDTEMPQNFSQINVSPLNNSVGIILLIGSIFSAFDDFNWQLKVFIVSDGNFKGGEL